MEGYCGCGCGASLEGLRADADFLNDSHSKKHRRRLKRERQREAEQPQRRAILSEEDAGAAEAAAKREAELVTAMEHVDVLSGRSLRGRIGAPMGRPRGILPSFDLAGLVPPKSLCREVRRDFLPCDRCGARHHRLRSCSPARRFKEDVAESVAALTALGGIRLRGFAMKDFA